MMKGPAASCTQRCKCDGVSVRIARHRQQCFHPLTLSTCGVLTKPAVAEGIAVARASKQAKRVDDVWAQLRAQSGGSACTSAPSSTRDDGQAAANGGAIGSTAAAAAPAQRLGGGFNLAAFCRPVPKKQKGVDEVGDHGHADDAARLCRRAHAKSCTCTSLMYPSCCRAVLEAAVWPRASAAAASTSQCAAGRKGNCSSSA